MSFYEEGLRDVFGWRCCVIFLTHLLTRLQDFCCGEVVSFFCVERLHFVDKLHFFLCGEVA